MIIFKHSDLLRRYLEFRKIHQATVGFVPTMGALHRGHMSLLEKCKRESAISVCSIFINPTQFNNQDDYEKYPTSIEQDIYKIESVETDVLFLPDVSQLYPNGTAQLEHYELGYLETILEGKFRPGHFQGVCQVMSRLLKIINPDKLFMGQKDYQQSLVIQHLLNTMHADTELVICPTERETNGLAMSSRNLRLPESEKETAGAIYQSLMYLKQNLKIGELAGLRNEASSSLTRAGLTADYVEMADAHSLHLVDSWNGKQELVALIAAYSGDVRLIDNMLLNG